MKLERRKRAGLKASENAWHSNFKKIHMLRLKTLLSLIFFVLLFILNMSPKTQKVYPLYFGNKKIMVELAITWPQRARGFMYRPLLDKDRGMLFVFNRNSRHCFWMKNTKIPLSIAFIDKGLKIIKIADMKPYDLSRTCSGGKCMFALEVNKGWFRKNGIIEGMRVRLSNSIKMKLRD